MFAAHVYNISLPRITVGAGTFPYDLVPKLINPKNCVLNHFQIMTRRWVTMEKQATGWLQHAVQFDQPRRHHRQVGHHLVCADDLPQRPDHRRHALRPFRDQCVKGLFGSGVPVPGILEGGDLRVGLYAALILEKHVVGSAAVERRIGVDQINALVRNMFTQDRQVVTVKERVVR